MPSVLRASRSSESILQNGEFGIAIKASQKSGDLPIANPANADATIEPTMTTTTTAKPTAADHKAATDKGDDLPPGLLDVCSLVLPFFDSTEVAQLGSTSKSWSETTTASSLPLVLRRELVTSRALPDRLVKSIDEMEGESLGHWRRFAQQWTSKAFVRADLGAIDAVAPPAKEDIVADDDLAGDDEEEREVRPQ